MPVPLKARCRPRDRSGQVRPAVHSPRRRDKPAATPELPILVRVKRPAGVTACAALFICASGYLLAAGLVMLAEPGVLPLRAGAPLLQGMEIAGPYLFLLMSALGVLIGWGLLRLNPWARYAAILVAAIGLAAFAPGVLQDVLSVQLGDLFWSGLGIAVRAVVIWYLYQAAEAFQKG